MFWVLLFSHDVFFESAPFNLDDFSVNDAIRKLAKGLYMRDSFIVDSVKQERFTPQIFLEVELVELDVVVDNEHVEDVWLFLFKDVDGPESVRIARVEETHMFEVV